MESLRQRVLQAELERIEAEAANDSRLILEQADTLAAAHHFCGRINEGLSPDRHCRPIVIYHADHCEIVLHPRSEADFVQRCRKLGAGLRFQTPAWEQDVKRRTSIDVLPGVFVYLPAHGCVAS